MPERFEVARTTRVAEPQTIMRSARLSLRASLALLLVLPGLTSWSFGQGWLNDTLTVGLALITVGLLALHLRVYLWQPDRDNSATRAYDCR